jgi:hypothetical protein
VGFSDINKPYRLFCDSSDLCLSGVLSQDCEPDDQGSYINQKPIYFISHRFNKTQRKYSIADKEFLAIFYCVNKLHHYLHGGEFTIYTDQKSLIHILDKPFNNKKNTKMGNRVINL